MRTPKPIPEEAKEVLKRILKETKDKWSYQRVQCVWLRAALGMKPDEIGLALGWNPVYVRQVQANYLREGVEALQPVGRGGRYHQNLALEEEEELLKPFFRQAEEGGILVVTEIRAAYEAKVGHAVPKSTVYRMLERHGWRKIAPRPRHPKSDPVAQAAFKKTSEK